MPSPLPGMDPFLECEEWEDFHTTFNTVARETLSPKLEPRYLVRVERRIYVEHGSEDGLQARRADVAVMRAELDDVNPPMPTGATMAMITPVRCILPMPEERREAYLVIRKRGTREVVTVIETLSPGNKRPGGDGRREYLRKRDEILRSDTHLVELDLLRGGRRLPTIGGLPVGDYYVIVSRSNRRPRADVYPWTLRHRLPSIPIPLKEGEADVLIDLQSVFDIMYYRARYDLSIDYAQPLVPPLSERDEPWIQQLVARRRA